MWGELTTTAGGDLLDQGSTKEEKKGEEEGKEENGLFF